MSAVPPVTAQGVRVRSGNEWRTWRRGDGNSNLAPLIFMLGTPLTMRTYTGIKASHLSRHSPHRSPVGS